MIRKQRVVLPVLALLVFEVAAVLGLRAIGSSEVVRIPWGDLEHWLNESTVDQLAPPLVWLSASILAYWMLISTILSIVARLIRIPGAVRATSAFTLPGVTRMVEGAVAVSIVTTSVVGFQGASAFADDSNSIVLVAEDTSDDSQSVATPLPGGDTYQTEVTVPEASVETPQPETSQPGQAVIDAFQAGATVGQSAEPSTPPPTVTSTTTSTTVKAFSAPQSNASDANSVGSTGFVSGTTGGKGSTTSVPSEGSVTQVLGAQEHRVVSGENLWTISRDALAAATNRSPSSLSNQEIADYWVTVVDANKNSLRSGDPHWIFPDEIIHLPAVNVAK